MEYSRYCPALPQTQQDLVREYEKLQAEDQALKKRKRKNWCLLMIVPKFLQTVVFMAERWDGRRSQKPMVRNCDNACIFVFNTDDFSTWSCWLLHKGLADHFITLIYSSIVNDKPSVQGRISLSTATWKIISFHMFYSVFCKESWTKKSKGLQYSHFIYKTVAVLCDTIFQE